MLAKGRLLGDSVSRVDERRFILRFAKHANQQAMKIKQTFKEIGLWIFLEQIQSRFSDFRKILKFKTFRTV